MPLTICRVEDPAEFADLASPYLLQNEARHNLELGILDRLRDDPSAVGDEPAHLAAALHGADVVGIAMRTPPHNLLLSAADPAAIPPLADDLRERFEQLRGILSDPPTAAAFAARWGELTGQEATPGMPQRIYELTRAPDQPDAPGRYRIARHRDRDLLVRWIEEFTAEAVPDQAGDDVERFVGRRLDAGGRSFVLWEDGEPVSLAGVGAFTPNGARIGPVYTPPAVRGRGYAAAVVARLCRDLLESGRRFCFLFTDRRNATSNRLYVRLGYEPVCDIQEVRFSEAPAGPPSR
ncbi:MAG TPA: GNAT family N-acetyltransferase [Actinomycetota bacterium]